MGHRASDVKLFSPSAEAATDVATFFIVVLSTLEYRFRVYTEL